VSIGSKVRRSDGGSGCAGAPEARLATAELQQDVGEHVLRLVFRGYPVSRHHDDGSAFIDASEDLADGPVDPDSDVPHRITDQRTIGLVEPLMRRVVQVPRLMADAMGFGEHLGEESPSPPAPESAS
jgi:hypothetical protein